ncbi:MAG: ATP-dependent DNA ligase, partial [Chloroflexota bacterium]
LYEPKWDGFRCLVFREGASVDLRSRHDRPLGRYFPEIVAAVRELPDEVVLDGELILAGPTGSDFAALMGRLHPAATRVERLSREAPASYVAFDLLAAGGEDLRSEPFVERRRRLEALLRDVPAPIVLTPSTADPDEAERWFEEARGGGVDGVVAKEPGLRYEPGRRSMVKVKHERTADCVVAGARFLAAGRAISSLLLGLYDDREQLRHVGVVTNLPTAMRIELVDELAPRAIPLEDHPWREGFLIGRSPLGRLRGSAARWTPDMEHDWLPLRPDLVCEVGYDQVDVDRFRHPARFRRWRPDRVAASCRLDQIEVEAPPLLELVATG